MGTTFNSLKINPKPIVSFALSLSFYMYTPLNQWFRPQWQPITLFQIVNCILESLSLKRRHHQWGNGGGLFFYDGVRKASPQTKVLRVGCMEGQMLKKNSYSKNGWYNSLNENGSVEFLLQLLSFLFNLAPSLR